MSSDNVSNFDYSSIPEGHYDHVLENGSPMRKFWHWHKFSTVMRSLGENQNKSLLDIGCFAGSFLKQIPENEFSRQVGVDILDQQIAYANDKHGTAYREFKLIQDFFDIQKYFIDDQFDYVTLIEVIEHLTHEQIHSMMSNIAKVLKPGGTFVLTTPNYLSIWPLLEFILNQVSDISYEEQHITKFTYFNFASKLAEIYPPLNDEFELEFKTTTHFLTPFTAPLNYAWSVKASKTITPDNWSFPFGPIILMKLKRLG
jgi:2-polyprenyl-3-methyl-5-hydroxy-6-metoxy-1,4-benzoquinol methylase